MRFISRNVAFAAMGMLLVPQLAVANDVEEQLRVMQERMAQMEDRLQAASDKLEAANAKADSQQAVIERAGLAEERNAGSALSSFLEKTEISSWVATSYNYNFNGSDNAALATGGQNAGTAFHLPDHPNPNTFQLDQAWISIDKSPTEESRAGMHIDFAAGQSVTHSALTPPVTSGPAGFTPTVHTAYASYLAPIGNGVQLDAGVLPTLLGAEVTQTNANFNITRGLVYGLQPVTNTGAVFSTGLTDELTLALGILNDPINNEAWDSNRGKALTSQIKYAAEKFALSAAFNYGKNEVVNALNAGGATSNDATGLLDVVLSANPTENLAAWINYDFRWDDENGGGGNGKIKAHGIAAAARLEVLESTGVAARFEYVKIDPTDFLAGSTKTDAFSLTGTVDHGLTDNLTLKGEVRWDSTDPNVLRNEANAPTKESQVVGLAQLIYEF